MIVNDNGGGGDIIAYASFSLSIFIECSQRK